MSVCLSISVSLSLSVFVSLPPVCLSVCLFLSAYSQPKMTEELQTYFGQELIITELNEKFTVVTFTRNAYSSQLLINLKKKSKKIRRLRRG